ncbi:MAG: hypothetical protein JNL90_20360 [Planctomycetes bacterium]|nr:hypothetical protein [Planctomycetota bacterium]
MAQQRDDDVDPTAGRGEPPRPPQEPEGRAPAADGSGKFLPDDSFLLDLDDELLAGPAAHDPAGDEFLLVDDESAVEAGATPASAAPLETASEAPIDLPIETQLDALVEASGELANAAAAEPQPVAERESLAAEEEVAPTSAAAAAESNDDSMESLTAIAAKALAPQFRDGRRKENAPAAPATEAPLVGAASGERAMLFGGAAEEAEAPRPAVPSWLERDESELPSFVGEEEDGAATAKATEIAPAAPVDAAVAPLAPVVELARPKRRFVAAAGMLLAAALTAALAFELDRRGLLRPTPDAGEPVAVVSAPEVDATPPDDAAASDAASDAGSDVASDAPLTADETVFETPLVDGGATPTEEPLPVVEPPPVVATEPVAEPAAAPVVVAEPIVERPTPAPEIAVERATPPPRGPEAVVLEPPRKRPLPYGQAAPRNSLEGAETIVQLENGHSFRGRIQRVRGTSLTLKFGAGECVFDLDEISLLESTAPEYRREEEMPEASVVLHNGQRVRGRLMKQTRENVVLVVDNGQVVFPRAEVKDVSFTGRIHF